MEVISVMCFFTGPYEELLEVEYNDSPPWPDADGNGLHLKLADPGLRDRSAANWIATGEAISSTEVVVATEEFNDTSLTVWPNPSNGELNIIFAAPVECHGPHGRKVAGFPVDNTHEFQFSISHLPGGVYTITIRTREGSVRRRIVSR